MPAFCSHYLLSHQIRAQIARLLPSALDEQALNLGTQGPDLLFFTRPWPTESGLFPAGISSRLHRMRPSRLLDALAEQVKKSPDSLSWSYAAGFLCHYALDAAAHPYVYAKQASLRKKAPYLSNYTCHNRIELGMDSALLHRIAGVQRPAAFPAADTIRLPEEKRDRLGGLFADWLETVWPNTGVTPKNAPRSLLDFQRFQSLLKDRTGFFRPFLQGLDFLAVPLTLGQSFSALMRPHDPARAARKYGNDDHQIWFAPARPDEPRRESFQDLFEAAVQDALRMIAEFVHAVAVGESTRALTRGERGFLTGAPVEEGE